MQSSQEKFQAGETVYCLNPKYSDGTRLRSNPTEEKSFTEIVVINDTIVKILDIKADFALIAKTNGDSGWIRLRNLTHSKRVQGLDKMLVKNEIVTPDNEQVRGVKLYGIGIKADPGNNKLAKGDYHLISPIWYNDIAEYMSKNQRTIRIFIKNAQMKGENGFFQLFNSSRQLFNKSLISGLKDDLDLLKLSTVLLMSAAEIDDFPFTKYTSKERKVQKERFLEIWCNEAISIQSKSEEKLEETKQQIPEIRFDLLPFIAMERFGINSSLSVLKQSEDPMKELRDGFKLSRRVDSLIRHQNSVLQGQKDEDHIIHALWNLHAIYHNIILFPEKNDLVQFQMKNAIEFKRYDPTSSLEIIDSKEQIQPISEVLKYDWNEGVIPPPENVIEALKSFLSSSNRLKWQPHLAGGHYLKKKILNYVNSNIRNLIVQFPEIEITENNLIITNGSDDALILICHRLLNQNKKILIPLPTQEHFCLNALATGAKVESFSQKNYFKNNNEEMFSQLDFHLPDVCYLVSPNNPTGTLWEPQQIEELLKKQVKTTFIIDEAYFEFGNGSTCVCLAKKQTNIIVTRTASKAFCLASIRCGQLITHENTMKILYDIQNPKSVNEFAQIAFSSALDVYETYYKPQIQAINEKRKKFIDDLNSNNIEGCSGGFGNFVCVKIGSKISGKEVCDKLKEKSIYVRDISSKVPEFIRITIGLDMEKVVAALKEILKH